MTDYVEVIIGVIGGLIWLGIGAIIFAINVALGRKPELTIREDEPVAGEGAR